MGVWRGWCSSLQFRKGGAFGIWGIETATLLPLRRGEDDEAFDHDVGLLQIGQVALPARVAFGHRCHAPSSSPRVGGAQGASLPTALAAWAQRDPAYEAARSSGQVGEKMDGYLGIVGAETAELKRLVNDINIKRRAVYAEKAQAANATLEEYSLTAGCIAISRTTPGEKYQAPDGSWKTRTAAAPERDARCP